MLDGPFHVKCREAAEVEVKDLKTTAPGDAITRIIPILCELNLVLQPVRRDW
jgi:hypothetical protein